MSKSRFPKIGQALMALAIMVSVILGLGKMPKAMAQVPGQAVQFHQTVVPYKTMFDKQWGLLLSLHTRACDYMTKPDTASNGIFGESAWICKQITSIAQPRYAAYARALQDWSAALITQERLKATSERLHHTCFTASDSARSMLLAAQAATRAARADLAQAQRGGVDQIIANARATLAQKEGDAQNWNTRVTQCGAEYTTLVGQPTGLLVLAINAAKQAETMVKYYTKPYGEAVALVPQWDKHLRDLEEFARTHPEPPSFPNSGTVLTPTPTP